MKGRFGHLPPTQWTVRLYWGFLSCPRTVTQAITKPYCVIWWGFADDSTGVSWLQLLMEYICLLNHLPAGCAVISLLPTLWAACVRQGEERRHLEVLFADSKGMEREDKTLHFFFPFFFPALAVRPHITWFCHWDMELHFTRSIVSCSPALCHWHHYRPWCSFIFLYQVSVLSLGPRFPKPANDNECLNLVKCGGTIEANSPQKMPSRALPLEDVKEEHHEHLVNVHHVILMYKKLFYWFKQNKSIGHFHPCPSNYLLRFVSC